MKICMSYMLRSLFLVLVFSSIACAEPKPKTEPMPGFPYPYGVDLRSIEEMRKNPKDEIAFKDTTGRVWSVIDFNKEQIGAILTAGNGDEECLVTSATGGLYKYPVFHIDKNNTISYYFYLIRGEEYSRFFVQTKLAGTELEHSDIEEMRLPWFFDRIKSLRDLGALDSKTCDEIYDHKVWIIANFFLMPDKKDEFLSIVYPGCDDANLGTKYMPVGPTGASAGA